MMVLQRGRVPLVVLALLASVARPSLGADLFVALDSPEPTPPYTNWLTAAHTIQDAVDAAEDGDTVWVAAGVYATGGRAGYPAGSPVTNRVAIHKPITVRAVSTNAADTTIRGVGPLGHAAVRGAYVGPGAMMIGFTVTGGHTGIEGSYYQVSVGGGVWADRDGVVSNCIVTANAAIGGGGIYGGTLYNCDVRDNVALWSGGGVLGSVAHRCTLRDNTCYERGGGAFDATLHDCVFSGNLALQHGGGAYLSTLYACALIGNGTSGDGGGAAYSVLRGCSVERNMARVGGGAYDSFLEDCDILMNAGYWGGGVSRGTLRRCMVFGNWASYEGGGMHNALAFDSTFTANVTDDGRGGGAFGGTMRNCRLIDNWAEYGGGAHGSKLFGSLLVGNQAHHGGGMRSCEVFNCTVVGNSAIFDVGGVYDSIVHNSIVIGNTVGGSSNHVHNYQATVFSSSCTTPLPPGPGNIDADPGFVAPLTGDYRLRADSPCINAGTNEAWMAEASDLDGVPRIVGPTVDMGAYEYPLTPAGIPGAWLRDHGLSTDGSADFLDSDGDGMDNRGEYEADTVPTDANSVLRLIAVGEQFGGIRIDWTGGRAAWQFVEVREDLTCTGATWTAIYALPPPTSPTNAVVDLGATNRTLFYRIRANRAVGNP